MSLSVLVPTRSLSPTSNLKELTLHQETERGGGGGERDREIERKRQSHSIRLEVCGAGSGTASVRVRAEGRQAIPKCAPGTLLNHLDGR